VSIHSTGQTVPSLSHIEGITLGAGEEVDEGAGEASGMGAIRIGEVGDRVRERQAAGIHEASGKERSQGWAEGDRERG
jgi:hypothetical protein